MMRKLWAIILISLLVVAGCGGQPVEVPGGDRTPSGQILQIALPRLVVDVDAQGNPSILGISPALLSAVGVDVSGFRLPEATVEQLIEAGIQHLELVSAGDRLLLFADAKPLPHLTWTPESLGRALDFAGTFNVENAATLRRIIPIITRLGLDVVLRLPRDPGITEIPMTNAGTVRNITPVITTDPISVIVKFEVTYNSDGMPGIMGLSPEDVAALGLGIGRIGPDTLGRLQANNIQHVEIRTKPDGAYIYVNNELLPTLTWDTQTLANLVELYTRIAGEGGLAPLIEALAPYLDRADIGILIHFPVASGQTPIEAEMH
jgi:hypothetical protein